MDDNRFDALTRALGSSSGRRGVVHSLVAGALGSLSLLSTLESMAGKKQKPKPKPNKKKKKKSCKAPKVKCGKLCCKAGQSCVDRECLAACEFPSIPLPPGSTLTLQESCATTSTLTLTEGVTLDGAGKTIRFTGPVSGYEDIDSNGTSVRAGLLLQATNVTVRNLTLDQSAIGCEANRPHSAIVIESASTIIESVVISSGADIRCFRGIDADTTISNQRFLADGITISGLFESGIAVAGPFDATIKNSRVEECLFGIAGRNLPNRLDIDNNNVTANFGGILLGRAGSNVTVRNNSVTGRASGSNFFGVHIDNSGGTVTGNTISNYNCGIKLEAGAGAVTGIDPNQNTITPAAAGQAICDERP